MYFEINNIRYDIKVNTYCLHIMAKSDNNKWKRLIKHHDLICDVGIDAQSLINIFRQTSDIISILSYKTTNLKENDDNLYIVVNNEYIIAVPSIN